MQENSQVNKKKLIEKIKKNKTIKNKILKKNGKNNTRIRVKL